VRTLYKDLLIFTFSKIEVSAGTVPYPWLKTLQVPYRIPSATAMGYGNFR